ncbi:redoxin domain-containing protein [Streptomyces sp. NPDC008317]|uniref:peroxiredoxin-like family protein n=1 Tax=Streptomyces sp. NPDC008317 TaxID=3364827 RepID=UPI0036EFA461
MRKTETTFTAGDLAPSHVLTTMTGETVAVPEAGYPVHLQFRRFAGCPVCNLHLRSFVRRADEIRAAGIHEVVVFHAPDEELLKYEAELPFAVVGDPDKTLYREFGVETSIRAVADPRVWPAIARAVGSSMWGAVRRRNRMAPVVPTGGSLGLPADFLIAPDGRIVAAKYGEHAYDQWSVDELLAHAAQPAATAPADPTEAPA